MGRVKDHCVEVDVADTRIIMRDAYSPSLQKLADGSIVMTGGKKVDNVKADISPSYDFTKNPELLDSIREKSLYFSSIRSADGGNTWRPVPPHPYRGKPSSKGVLADGTAVGVFARTHPAGDQPGMYVGKRWVSKDNWETVTQEPVYVKTPEIFRGYADQGPGEGIDGPCFHTDFLTLPNGDLIAAVMANFEEDTGFTTTRIKWRSILVRSADGGESWEYVSTIASMASLETTDQEALDNIPQGFAEPSIARLPDGNLVCVIRTGVSAYPAGPSDSYHDLQYTHLKDGKYYTTSKDPTQPLYVTLSTDEGETWSKQKMMASARGACPRLLALANGVLALAYGRVARPSQGCRIIFSIDGGNTWTRETDIYPGLSTGYTEMVEMAPGRILYAFDACTADGPKVPDWIGAVDIEVRLLG